MSDTLLEQIRGGHEDMERLERMIVNELSKHVHAHREKVEQATRIRQMLDKSRETATRLKHLYEDHDHSRKEETSPLRDQESENDVYTDFYGKFKEIVKFYRRFPHLSGPLDEPLPCVTQILDCKPATFTVEEGYGRYLDLHSLHLDYINLKFGIQCDYSTYVRDNAWNLHRIPTREKSSQKFRLYLSKLVDYIESFYTRSHPLETLEKVYTKSSTDSDTKCLETPSLNGSGAVWSHKGIVDLAVFSSLEEIKSLGGFKLKMAMRNLGLKNSSNTKVGAVNLWHSKGNMLSWSNAKLPVLNEVLSYEQKLTRLVSELGYVIEDTLANIEKKATRTAEEGEADFEADIVEEPFHGKVDDDDYVYNPLRLPLGPDGKPIPYWLYKLHGLNRKFECEICGNHVYEGRRAFEKHFKEPRHQQGMQALGIPNSRVFFEITNIGEAINLWYSLNPELKLAQQNGSLQEFEDVFGNVYDKETYDLLKKQGIV